MSKIAYLCGAAMLAVPARAHAALNFDATQVEPDQGVDVVPPGWYNVQMDESEMKPTKDGTGSYLAIRFSILDGQYANRKIFTNLNLKNQGPNAQQTMEIAQRQLSAICHAVGVLRPQDSSELHGKPLKIKVKIRKGTGEYSDSNDIQSYKNINEQVDMAGGDNAQGAAAFGAGSPAASAGGAGGAPAQPWASGAAQTMGDKPAAASESPAQPWNQAPAAEAADAPDAPPAPDDEAPATPEEHDPVSAAEADGWKPHPKSPGWHYKGKEVVKTAALGEKYPAPDNAPSVPDEPEAPAAPEVPAAEEAASTAKAEDSSAAAEAAQGANPPWANNG